MRRTPRAQVQTPLCRGRASSSHLSKSHPSDLQKRPWSRNLSLGSRLAKRAPRSPRSRRRVSLPRSAQGASCSSTATWSAT